MFGFHTEPAGGKRERFDPSCVETQGVGNPGICHLSMWVLIYLVSLLIYSSCFCLFPPDPLHDYPTLIQLSELPVDDIWFNIGLHLGLSQEELSDIERKNQPTQERKISMFRSARIKISDLKYDNLIKAVFEVGNKELSGDICTERGLSSCTVL